MRAKTPVNSAPPLRGLFRAGAVARSVRRGACERALTPPTLQAAHQNQCCSPRAAPGAPARPLTTLSTRRCTVTARRIRMGCVFPAAVDSAALTGPSFSRTDAVPARRSNSESAQGRPEADEEAEAEASFKSYIAPVRRAPDVATAVCAPPHALPRTRAQVELYNTLHERASRKVPQLRCGATAASHDACDAAR